MNIRIPDHTQTLPSALPATIEASAGKGEKVEETLTFKSSCSSRQ